MEDPCKQHEPLVIDHNMIAKCLEEQGLKGEMGRLAREEGIPWEEVDQIRLEFNNILRIDHLWVLPSLTVLSISNNKIEIIENLEALVNLKELDLSFNKITKIQNLENLINIEILNLFENRIDTIENLDQLTKMQIFSMGNNKISNRDKILYLRRFKVLKSVNLAGNPCVDLDADSSFRIFIATFLPQIVYYEYKSISDDERTLGFDAYKKKLAALEEDERGFREKQEKMEAEAAEAELQSESFVEFLNSSHLFDQLFEDDAEGRAFFKMGEEAKEYYVDFETQFLESTKQIFEVGQEQFKIRKTEVEQFMKIAEGAKTKNQLESIEHMEAFTLRKREMLAQIRELKENLDLREINMQQYQEAIAELTVTYDELIHGTWKTLMGIELTLFEQIEETNQVFEQTLTEMVNSFIEVAQGAFANIRSLEGTYFECMSELAGRYMTTASITPEHVMPKELAPYMVDKDAVINASAASHDIHLQVIDNREDRLLKRARTWLSNLVNDLQKDEVTRDRSKVLEINHFLDIQKEEFDDHCTIQEVGEDKF